MDTVIVSGALVAFILLMLPAVIAPFIDINGPTRDIARQSSPSPIANGKSAPSRDGATGDDRLAA